MSTQIQRRRGTTAQHSSFTGALGETTVDTDKDVVVVHDGVQVGGYPQMRENGSNSALALGSASTPSLKFTGDTNTGLYSPGADQLALATGGSGRLFIDSSGNVGLGATPSGSYKLEVKAGAIDSAAIFDSTNAVGPHLRFSTSGTDKHYLGSVPGFTAGGTSSDFGIRTAGYLALSTGGNNERLRITSGGLVGIGTSSIGSGASLQVGANGANIAIGGDLSANGSGRFKFITSNTVKNWQISNNDNVSGAFEITPSTAAGGTTFSTPAFLINSSGNVGIGTTSPGQPLTVNSTSTSSIANFTTNQSATNIFISDNNTSANLSIGSAGNNLTFQVSGSERFRCDSSGRLLLGTSSARATFGSSAAPQFQSEGTSTATGSIAVIKNNTSDGGCLFLANTGGTTVGSTTATGSGSELGAVSFNGSDGTNFKEGATIRAVNDQASAWASGDCPTRLVFSTTADGASSPTERMRIHANGFTTFTTSNTSQSVGTGVKLSSNGNVYVVVSSGDSFSHHDGSSGYKFYVANSGAISSTSGTISVISDQRFKENIRNLDEGLGEILALKPRKFDWKEGKGSGAKDERGFIAQEFEQVFPDLIGEWKDQAPEGEEPYKSVRADLIPVLVKAIQQQQELIIELQAKVAALETA